MCLIRLQVEKFLVDNQKNIWLSCDSGVDMITFLNGKLQLFLNESS